MVWKSCEAIQPPDSSRYEGIGINCWGNGNGMREEINTLIMPPKGLAWGYRGNKDFD